MNRYAQYLAGLAVLFLAVAWSGCGHPRYNVSVELDPTLKDESGKYKTVEVHLLVSRSKAEHDILTNMSITDYWMKPSADDEVFVMKLGHDMPREVLEEDHPIWERWHRKGGAQWLFIISSLPRPEKGDAGLLRGNADPRRLILPLDSGAWDWYFYGERDIPIAVKDRPKGLECGREHEEPIPYEDD